MLGRLRQSGVMKNYWLALIACVVLLTLWALRTDEVAQKTYSNGISVWYTDRWTGVDWVHIISTQGGGRAPVTALEGEAEASFRRVETARAKALTWVWGAMMAGAVCWLGYSLTTHRSESRLNQQAILRASPNSANPA